MEDGNAFLPGFMERFNEKFARTPAKDHDSHRPLNIPVNRLPDVLCTKDQRYVGQQLTLTYERKKIMLVPNDVTRGLAGQYIDIHGYPDGSFTVHHKGASLPFTVYDRDQREIHTEVVDNKRLSAMLELAKAQQDKLPPPKTARTSRRNGYVKKGGKQGPKPGTSYLAKRKSTRSNGVLDV